MQRKVHIENQTLDYAKMFMDNGWIVVSNAEDADLICFTGGSDVSPMLYEESKHPATRNNLQRDEKCCELFYNNLRHNNVPVVGICRGGQFLNVMAGGWLYQDVNNHTEEHEATDSLTGEQVRVSSTHHQMMICGDGGEILLQSDRSLVKLPIMWEDENFDCDAECILYPEQNIMCYQPHPEFYDIEHECQVWFFETLNQYLMEKEE